jgi:TrmH RNA methyltransferase
MRLYFSKERSSQVNDIKKLCHEKKLPYRELDNESLNKVASSVHHEGVVMVARPRQMQSVHNLIRGKLPADGIVLAIDRVSNTHNLGAILRSCAFFGAEAMVLGLGGNQVTMTSSAARMAEGALETVPIYQSNDLTSALRDFRDRKVFVVGADLAGGQSLYDTKISFPCVLVMGNEQEGLSPKVRKRCDAIVTIPTTGTMQSLNVSVAAGVILAELRRRQQADKSTLLSQK